MTRSNVQEAVYQRLNDPDIVALLSTNWDFDAVFAEMPDKKHEAADFPFVTIARGADQERSDKLNPLVTYGFQIDVWARDWGSCEAIADMIRKKLHRQEMTVTEARVLSVDVINTTMQTETDEKTRRAIIDVTVLAQEFRWFLADGVWGATGFWGGSGNWGNPS